MQPKVSVTVMPSFHNVLQTRDAPAGSSRLGTIKQTTPFLVQKSQALLMPVSDRNNCQIVVIV
jgi:hypothetical protein